MFKIELPLRDGFRGYNMTADVALDGLCGSQLEISSVKSVELVFVAHFVLSRVLISVVLILTTTEYQGIQVDLDCAERSRIEE